MQNDQHTYFQAPFFPFSVFHDIHCIASKIPYIWCHSIPFILPKVEVNKKTFPFSLTFLIVWMSQLKTYQFRKLYMSLLRSIWQCCWKEDGSMMSLMTMQSMGDYCHRMMMSRWWLKSCQHSEGDTMYTSSSHSPHHGICLGRIKLWQLDHSWGGWGIIVVVTLSPISPIPWITQTLAIRTKGRNRSTSVSFLISLQILFTIYPS